LSPLSQIFFNQPRSYRVVQYALRTYLEDLEKEETNNVYNVPVPPKQELAALNGNAGAKKEKEGLLSNQSSLERLLLSNNNFEVVNTPDKHTEVFCCIYMIFYIYISFFEMICISFYLSFSRIPSHNTFFFFFFFLKILYLFSP
jgi:hypothetical protein